MSTMLFESLAYLTFDDVKWVPCLQSPSKENSICLTPKFSAPSLERTSRSMAADADGNVIFQGFANATNFSIWSTCP